MLRIRSRQPEIPFRPWKAHCTWGAARHPKGRSEAKEPRNGSGADRIVGANRPGVCYSDAAYATMT